MRTVRRLRLRCLVFGTTLSCCLFRYLTMSKPNTSPTKHTQSALRSLYRSGTIKYTSVEKEGVEPSSTVPSLRRNYNNSLRLLMIRPTTYFCRNTKRLSIKRYCQGNQYNDGSNDDLIKRHYSIQSLIEIKK